MNKKQRIILITTALLIFVTLVLQAINNPTGNNLPRFIEKILFFGVPGGLLYLAFRDKHEK